MTIYKVDGEVDMSPLEAQIAAQQVQIDQLLLFKSGLLIPAPIRTATTIVAASDATFKVKNSADLVCDGVDDQQTLEVAFYAGGLVYLSEGTFKLSAQAIAQTDRLRVAGAGESTVLTGAGISVKRQDGARPVERVTLNDFVVDGAIGDGIEFFSFNGNIQRVNTRNCGGSGIRIGGYAAWKAYNTRVKDCNIDHNTGDGLVWDAYASDQHAALNVIYSNGGAGVRIRTGGGQLVGGQLYDNDRNVVMEGGAQTQMQLVKMENDRRGAIWIDASIVGPSWIEITGCAFRRNASLGGFPVIGGAGTRAVVGAFISGNRFNALKDADHPNLPSYLVDVWGHNCSGWKVEGNMFDPISFAIAATRNSGTLCVVQAS